MKKPLLTMLTLGLPLALGVCAARAEYDIVIRNGLVYGGSGSKPVVADVAIKGDRIAAVGQVTDHARRASAIRTSMPKGLLI